MSSTSTIEWTDATCAGRLLDGRTWDEYPQPRAEVSPC